MRLKIGICDDEIIIRKEITSILKSEIVNCDLFEYTSGFELFMKKDNLDILLLDIEMPKMNGFDVAKKLRESNIDVYIIFLSFHNELMQKAFTVKAYRFLVKPIKKSELIKAIMNVEEEIINHQTVVVKENEKINLVKLTNIIYIEAFGDGTYIYTLDKVYINSNSLKYWKNKLSTDYFVQTHKSYIVSLLAIISIGANEIELLGMKNKIPISRRNHKVVYEIFYEYIRKHASCIE